MEKTEKMVVYMYALLLFITVFMGQQRLRLLTIRSNKSTTEECYSQLRRKFRKKKIAWAFERPQFCFEHMVLTHYVWDASWIINRKSVRSMIIHVVLNAAEVSPRIKNSTCVVFQMDNSKRPVFTGLPLVAR